MADVVFEQEFPAEMAGELVGWVNVRRAEGDANDLVFANMMFARVGEEGARYQTLATSDGRPVCSDDSGFEDAAGVHVTAIGEGRPDVRSIVAPGLIGAPVEWDHEGRISAGLYSHEGMETGGGQWVKGGRGIIEALKGQLESQRAPLLYDFMYYSLTQYTLESMLLADPDMHDRTEELTGHAQTYLKKLHDMKVRDERMLQGLTVFGDLRPDEVEGTYVDLRSAGAQVEIELNALKDQVPFGHLYRRFESRPDMGKRVSSDVAALRKRDVEPAWAVLKQEMHVIASRKMVADFIVKRLRLLHAKEGGTVGGEDADDSQS